MPRSLLALALFLAAPTALAQPGVSLGADIVSRYVWRGIDYGDQINIQPTLAVTFDNVEVGTWASYSISSFGDGPAFAEQDFYVSASAGPASFGITDYYYPILNGAESSDFFNFDGDYAGAHTLEAFVQLAPESVPLSLLVATAFYNASDFPTYVELGTGFELGGLEWGAAAGAVFALDPPEGTTGSPFYGTTDDAALINLSLGATKDIPLTDAFSLPVSAALIVNPDSERSFLVFGVSL
ncbi:TorF family putative porin [Rubrivirga marina]|uniref:Uncharacterized protein n=1 Tax=Rubrivirga marina TaxID=1196024 RepID=A0A271J4N8_9BACT|nr:TorF family putative porin [Rubrivirga marina]PAP78247.1 hypothetical protein BSZ37_18350 [Rubrivirga marina]